MSAGASRKASSSRARSTSACGRRSWRRSPRLATRRRACRSAGACSASSATTWDTSSNSMASRALNRLRDASKVAAHHLGVLAVLRRLVRRDRAIILRYHAVAPDETPFPAYAGPEITIPRALFAAQMRFVRRSYTAVPLATIADAAGRGEAPPAGTVAITLDHG